MSIYDHELYSRFLDASLKASTPNFELHKYQILLCINSTQQNESPQTALKCLQIIYGKHEVHCEIYIKDKPHSI